MLDFPEIPSWWKGGSKFEYLEHSFVPPREIYGYDTETCNGEIISQQYFGRNGGDIFFVGTSGCLKRFLSFLDKQPDGFLLVFLFNASFDIPLTFRNFINRFLEDDWEAEQDGWKITCFCSKNWHCELRKGNKYVRILDIRSFFAGSLETVSQTFGIKKRKLSKPDELGHKKYTSKDKSFVDYAMQDAKLCYQMGIQIVRMHEEFDIPISSSSANLAEKVFRRMFVPTNRKIQFPPMPCVRLSELTYHGGKNGYYLDGPRFIKNIYEYDFNAAYGFAMYNLPSFLSGRYEKVSKYVRGYTGVYQVSGTIQPCQYGILFDADFDYFRFPYKQRVSSFCTSYELEEAMHSGEFKLKYCKGYIWKPDTKENPIHEYAKYFWRKKNETPKGDIRYIFYKLCLNSLYGKWIQRNPQRSSIEYDTGNGQIRRASDVAGGLYHPFIGSLITGFTRARLHKAEHYFTAIESSTDAVKTRRYDPEHDKNKGFGVMQLEHFKCWECDKKVKKANGLFVRNRLNLIMDKAEHILKFALHGFWGKKDELKLMWKEKRTEYPVQRMPLIREGLRHSNKNLFQFYEEVRRINIDWNDLKEE